MHLQVSAAVHPVGCHYDISLCQVMPTTQKLKNTCTTYKSQITRTYLIKSFINCPHDVENNRFFHGMGNSEEIDLNRR